MLVVLQRPRRTTRIVKERFEGLGIHRDVRPNLARSFSEPHVGEGQNGEGLNVAPQCHAAFRLKDLRAAMDQLGGGGEDSRALVGIIENRRFRES